MNRLFCFGLGYSASVLAYRLAAKGWHVAGTSRTKDGMERIAKMGFHSFLFSGESPVSEISDELARATHVVISIAPPEEGDPVLKHHAQDFEIANALKWIGYLSTVGVYGNWNGAWVDEGDQPRPLSERSKRRLATEKAWFALYEQNNLPLHIFRLAGIYGPGRNPLEALKRGTARRIVKQGQVFNRIHVDDIANVLEASIKRPNPGTVYNVTDNEPAPPQEVVTYAAELLGIESPPAIDFEQADLTSMARSFYGENKRVRNSRIKTELGVTLDFPTYREGLQALAKRLNSQAQ